MIDSDLDLVEEETLATGSVLSSFGFKHKWPDSVFLQTPMETGDPAGEALSPSTHLIRAAKSSRSLDFTTGVTK
ncbi:hypothetical protein MRX96_039885 [Rhipicephalus microplus]